MIELKGKYNEAKIFTDVVDEASISQVLLLLNQEFVSGSKIRLMPDIHAGAGCTIGTTMTVITYIPLLDNNLLLLSLNDGCQNAQRYKFFLHYPYLLQ